MNCLLIIPPEIDKKSLYSKTKLNQEGVFPPLGLAYIAAVLKNSGIKVKIIDSLAEKLTEEEVLYKINDNKPDLIGITVLTQQIKTTISIVEKIKKNKLSKCIALGGPHIHFEHSSVIKNEYVDFCVRGEGEITFKELTEALIYNDNLSKVKGITYKDKKDNTIITEDRPFIPNLDDIPFPARDLLNNSLYNSPISLGGKKPFTSILATRGCPFGCHFCSLTKMWGHQRRRSVENVLNEIEEVHKKYNIKIISFIDDLLVLNKKWAIELCKGICERGLNIKWDCCGRINLMSKELLKEMKKAGCECIIYGIEFGNQRILDFVGKGFKVEDVPRTISMTNQAKISVKGLFMMGYPTETKDTLQDTIDLAKKLKMDYIAVSLVAPYPGTDLYSYCLEHNLLQNLPWIDIMQLSFKAIKLKQLSIDDLIKYSNKINWEYMLRFSYIIRMLFKHPMQIIFFGSKIFMKLILSKKIYNST